MRALVIAWQGDAVSGLSGVLDADLPRSVIVAGEPQAVRGADDANDVWAAPDLDVRAQPRALGEALRPVIAGFNVVVLDSSQASRDLGGWLAGTLGGPVVWAIDRVAASDGGYQASRVVLDGGHRALHEVSLTGAPLVVIAKPTQGSSGERSGPRIPDLLSLSVPADPVTRRSLSEATQVSLAGARVVVAVGRGIKDPNHLEVFRKLANSAGGALGATRAVVDAGWLPFAHQIGQTGAAIAPDLYIGFGVSGAIQHVAGMRSSGTIVAVNTDPQAPLCQIADVVIEADAVQVAQNALALDIKETHEQL